MPFLMNSAPIPLGPYILWAEKDRKSSKKSNDIQFVITQDEVDEEDIKEVKDSKRTRKSKKTKQKKS